MSDTLHVRIHHPSHGEMMVIATVTDWGSSPGRDSPGADCEYQITHVRFGEWNEAEWEELNTRTQRAIEDHMDRSDAARQIADARDERKSGGEP